MKTEMDKFLAVAKLAVYNKAAAEMFMPLMETQKGAVHAVTGVVSAIEQKVKVPAQMIGPLAVNVYLMMVDVAMTATGRKPSKGIMQATINALLSMISGGKQQSAPPAPAPAPAGMIQQGV